MDNQSKKKEQHKFLTWVSAPIIMLIFAIGTTILWCLVHFTDGEAEKWVLVVADIMFLILPWGLTIWSIKFGWTVVIIDQSGIRRELFGFLFKRYISWEELYEIRFIQVPTGGGWIFFSKKSLSNMSLGKARSQKEQIQVVNTTKILETIQLYTNQEIVNLPNYQIEK